MKLSTLKNNSYIICLMLIISLPSCKKDWLDQKPDKNRSVPESIQDLEGMLDNTGLNTRSPLSLGEMCADEHYLLESRWQSGLSSQLANAYTWSNTLPYVNISDWNVAYENILICNVILEQLKKIKSDGSTIQQWNAIKGGALFQRARLFFELSQTFAPPYDAVTANSDLSIPIRLESDINLTAKRTTIKDVYDQVIGDLESSKDLLPLVPKYKTRPSKAAGYALLARVYLSLRNYSKAGEYADESLKINNTLLNFNTLSKSANFIGMFNNEVIFHTLSVNYNTLPSALKVEKSLYDLYDPYDLRKVIFFRIEPAGTIIFKGNYHRSAAPLFFGLTTSEMYLIRAEAFARAGNRDLAMEDVNTLYKTRWDNSKTYFNLTATSANDALHIILKERRKELFMRGQRWSDLRRLNKEPEFANTLVRTIGGKTYTLPPNSYKYTLPIPDDIIQLSKIQQNPGWNK